MNSKRDFQKNSDINIKVIPLKDMGDYLQYVVDSSQFNGVRFSKIDKAILLFYV